VPSQGAHPGETIVGQSPRLSIDGEQPTKANGELFSVEFDKNLRRGLRSDKLSRWFAGK